MQISYDSVQVYAGKRRFASRFRWDNAGSVKKAPSSAGTFLRAFMWAAPYPVTV
jgi:hypothetical protein